MIAARCFCPPETGQFSAQIRARASGTAAAVLCGFLVALVVVWIIVAGLFVFTPMLEPSVQWKMEDALNHSIIAGTLVNLNPLGGMFQAG